ncbi:MAG: ABC transporter ATP-binding protein, partial [Asgard group archaeon]|nr:ABC transporter ATP-binding protein [Asgard group archaeon]
MFLRRRGKYQKPTKDTTKEKQKRTISDIVLGKWVIGYFKDELKLVILVIILLVISSCIGLVTPYISSKIIDKGLGDDPVNTGNALLLLYYCLGMAGIVIMNAFLDIFKNIILYKIGFKSVRKIRRDTFAKVQSLSMRFFDEQETGQIISRVTNDCNKVNDIMSGSLITSLVDFVKIIGVSIFLIVMNWMLGIITIAISIPSVLAVSYLFKVRARQAYRKTRKTIANVTATFSESIDGVKVSKSFSQEKKNIKDFRQVNLADRKANLQAEAIFAVTYPIYSFISTMVVGLVYLYTGFTLLNEGASGFLAISIGEAIAFASYIGMFFEPILNLSMFFNTFQSTMAATERIYELNHTVSDVIEKEGAIELPRIKGIVKFNDVTFSYVKGEKVLDRFNLNVKPGESVAIVGPTGAGKPTIMSLLARFYALQAGE